MENSQFELLLHEIQESRRHTDATADGLRDELRNELRNATSEMRRHFDVVAEDLRGEIRLVAEGVLTGDAKLERFRAEVAQEFVETRSMIKLSYAELDRRLRVVETSRDL